jgi:hypothetical protein
MQTFCDCEDFMSLQKNDRKIFVEDPTYGWFLRFKLGVSHGTNSV